MFSREVKEPPSNVFITCSAAKSGDVRSTPGQPIMMTLCAASGLSTSQTEVVAGWAGVTGAAGSAAAVPVERQAPKCCVSSAPMRAASTSRR